MGRRVPPLGGVIIGVGISSLFWVALAVVIWLVAR